MTAKKPLIGFVGQGYVGGSYANNFEARGFSVVRYSLEPKWVGNKKKIRDCDIVFVCVPTPTTPKGFDISIVRSGLSLVGKGKIAIIKSTVQPGTTKALQKRFPGKIILCSPEFLSVATAQHDADHPFSNIIGIPSANKKHKSAARSVLGTLPKAPFSLIADSNEAELIKYAHNMSGYTQVLTFNLIYDMAQYQRSRWEPIQKAIEADPLVCNRYANPIHKSGRGAGGACFIKDMAAFARLYEKTVRRPEGLAFLKAAQKNNIALLTETGKDLHLLADVYGGFAARSKNRKKRK